MAEETQIAKKAIKTKPAPKPKKKEEVRHDTGCCGLDEKAKFTLTRSQRSALKKKGDSIESIKEVMTGTELNAAMARIKANAISLGITK